MDRQLPAVNNEEGKQEEMPAAGNLQEGAETAADDVQMEDADGARVGEGATNGTGGGATDENGDPSVNGAETQAATQQQPSDNPYAVNGTQQPAIPTVVHQQRDEALFYCSCRWFMLLLDRRRCTPNSMT
jgi:hypothetical protein